MPTWHKWAPVPDSLRGFGMNEKNDVCPVIFLALSPAPPLEQMGMSACRQTLVSEVIRG
jgi:hypothetical protein